MKKLLTGVLLVIASAASPHPWCRGDSVMPNSELFE